MFPCNNEMIGKASIACPGEEIAPGGKSDATGELAWNTAALPLSLIIPAFPLPSLSAPAVTTASSASVAGAPTPFAPNMTMEGSANRAVPDAARFWVFAVVFILMKKILLRSR
ncbi:hypothetical protein N7476_000360 [Penicillium atrosanguineum]|uniref:Uncharacterized protein n=1 Tax=Penicillium atrosanguineum TaxID=1132637 RepID=A0A9W9QGI6_9EURO|nr:hypothetical protein N7476_000360 [Penicillium atrosanguineum]